MNMKQLRERVGLTQEAVAYKLGVSYSTVRNWENGRTIPTFTPDQTIKALSIYACNLNELDLAVRETRERKAVDTKDERDHKASSHGADRPLTAGGAR